MLRTIEAVIEADGRVRLLEPVSLTTAHRALVTVLEESATEAGGNITALLSEPALSDWNSEEEGGAWGFGGKGDSLPRGMSGEQLRSLAGTISPEDLDIMERVIEEEFERIDPHGW